MVHWNLFKNFSLPVVMRDAVGMDSEGWEVEGGGSE